nr:MAG TPA: hypothetical protein [Caudoviricetes sp.]
MAAGSARRAPPAPDPARDLSPAHRRGGRGRFMPVEGPSSPSDGLLGRGRAVIRVGDC